MLSRKPQIQITLIGTPNAGKTSLFNYLTDEHNLIGNWDGVTLDLAKSSFNYLGNLIKVNDLPGCYSLVASKQMSLEEKLVCEYVNELREDVFINVISIENLNRDLYVTLQLLEQNCNMLIVLNTHINKNDQYCYKDQQKLVVYLKNTLGCQVVCCNVVTGFGILELKKSILEQANCVNNKQNDFLTLQKYISPQTLENLYKHIGSGLFDSVGKLIRFLEGDVIVNGLQKNVDLSLIADPCHSSCNQQWDVFFASKRHEFIKKNFIIDHNNSSIIKKTKFVDILDKITLHQYFGLPVFCAVIYLMFFCVTEIGNLTQNLVTALTTKGFVNPINQWLNLFDCPGWLLGIFNDGIAIGVSTLCNFIPILLVMHICLFVLENSGYIARAVFLIDRLMGFLGLSGKSLIPMIIGFGCNVPAIVGARVIEQKRDKIITILMTPFMSCNARLVTYSVFAMAFFESHQGNIIFYLYGVGIISAILTGFLLQKILSGSRTKLIMELPKYSIPSLNSIFKKSIYRVKKFLTDSGLLVISICTIIAGLKNIHFSQCDLLNCIVFKYVMLFFKPMGILADNWPAVAGLFSGLIAKEVIIGSLNSFYHTNNQEIFGVLYTQFGGYKAAFAYLLFVLLSFPCVSVVTSIAKELDTRWAIFSVIWTTGLAYVVSVFYYQIATFNEHPIYSTKLLLLIASVLLATLITIKMIIRSNKRHDAKMIPIVVG